MTGLVGRYMKNNQTGAIVAIKASRVTDLTQYLGYKTPKRWVWVQRDRVFGATEIAHNRLNGYTLLPPEYNPGAMDVA